MTSVLQRRIWRGVLCGMGLAATASPTAVQAQPAKGLIDATRPAAILEIAKGYGSAELTKSTTTGDPQISGRLDGTRYLVFFNECKEAKNCKSIQLYAAWTKDKKITVDRVNEWNRNKRWGKAYLDKDGDPVLEMDINMTGGVSRKALDDTFDWWRLLMREFEKYIAE